MRFLSLIVLLFIIQTTVFADLEADKAITHVTPGGDVVQHKLTFTPLEEESIRQLWEQSTDDGENWSVAFDGLYVRRSE